MDKTNRFFLYKLTPAIPVFQMVLTVLSSFYPLRWFAIGDTVGYSFMTGLVYITLFHFAVKHKYCFIPKTCTYGLISMNFVSLMKPLISYAEFNKIYDLCIMIVCFFMIVITWLKTRNTLEYDRNLRRS